MHRKDLLKLFNNTSFVQSAYNAPYYYEFCFLTEINNIFNEPIGYFISNENLVFEIALEVPDKNIFYRWVNPKYKEEMKTQLYQDGINPSIANGLFKYIELDLEEDIIEKLNALYLNKDLDPRVMIDISIPDDEFILLAKSAHEQDITFNKLTNNILKSIINKDLTSIPFNSGKDKNTENDINVEMSDDEFFYLAQEAHKKDITINQLVNDFILKDFINKRQKKKFSSF